MEIGALAFGGFVLCSGIERRDTSIEFIDR
jgi:hypothetical protein